MRTASPVILAVCGLKDEAQIAAGFGVLSLACGGHAATLKIRLSDAIERFNPIGLISFGIAGGLHPRLETGDVVIGTDVVAKDAKFSADEAWTAALLKAVPGAIAGTLAAVEQAVANTADKAALHQASGARAVDMESQHVARLAGAAKLPFAALRVIADPAHRALPKSALAGLKPDGSADVLAVLLEIAKAPGQVPALLKVAGDSRQALNVLLSSRACLGPGLGFPDFGKLVLNVP